MKTLKCGLNDDENVDNPRCFLILIYIYIQEMKIKSPYINYEKK